MKGVGLAAKAGQMCFGANHPRSLICAGVRMSIGKPNVHMGELRACDDLANLNDGGAHDAGWLPFLVSIALTCCKQYAICSGI